MTTKEFACIAEAVAHFHKAGFATAYDGDGFRVMRRHDGDTAIASVRIERVDFLRVVATEYDLTNPHTRLRALRDEQTNLAGLLAVAHPSNVARLTERAQHVASHIEFWEEKIADWESD